ncbi:MAG: hypothetical protein HUJ26_12625 [Planctomycetaceae bacterium]|nr:hypothetical protein [Planctomycetaceae bacterium]
MTKTQEKPLIVKMGEAVRNKDGYCAQNASYAELVVTYRWKEGKLIGAETNFRETHKS